MWAGFTSGGYFVTFSSRPAGTLEFLRVFFSSHLPGIIGLRFFNGDMKDWFVTDQICWGTPGTLPGHSRDTPGTLPGHSRDTPGTPSGHSRDTRRKLPTYTITLQSHV